MSEDYDLSKWLWTDEDFDTMGWHDATIHAIAFPANAFEFLFDIDYIFKWVKPPAGEEYYQFWVAPATLVFENVYDLRIDVAPSPELTIQDLHRSEPGTPRNSAFIGRETDWRWTIECHTGEMSFRSCGFRQFIRRPPTLGKVQTLEMAGRGGYSFARESGERRQDV